MLLDVGGRRGEAQRPGATLAQGTAPFGLSPLAAWGMVTMALAEERIWPPVFASLGGVCVC